MSGAVGARSGVAVVLDAKGVMEPYEEPRQARGWLILLLGIVVFAAFGVVVGYAYYIGLPGIGGEPPMIRAEAGAYRRAPDERGGLAVANANSSIVTVLRQQGETPRVERLLPPESAAPFEATEPGAEADDTAPAAPDASAVDLSSLPGDAAGAPAVPVPASKPIAAVQTATAAAAPPASSPAPRAAPVAPTAPAPNIQSPARLTAAEPPATAVPTPSRAVAASPAPAAAAPGANGAPQRLVRADPAARPAAASGGSVYRLQLAAVRSETGLTQAWADLRQRYPSALAAASPQVERTDTSSGPLFRLQAGPFTNRDAAVNACGAIRASGGQCFIVGPIGE